MPKRRDILRGLVGVVPALAFMEAGAADKAPICGGCSGNGQCQSGFCVNGYCAESETVCQTGYRCRKSFTCKSGVPTCCGSRTCAKKLAGGRCVTL